MSEERPRVAMIGYTFYESDARLIRHTRNLVDAGYDVDVISLCDPKADSSSAPDHVNIYPVQERRLNNKGGLRFFAEYSLFTLRTGIALLRNTFRDGRYAVAHVNNMPNFVLFGALPFRLFGMRVLLDIHDTMPELYMERAGVSATHWMVRALRFEEWICVKLADFVLTTEHTKRDRLLENGLTESKSYVLMNLADPAVFVERPIPDAPDDPDGPFRIVYHGTLARRLGVDITVQAIALLRDSIPNIRFEITGDGEQKSELEALVSELGIEEQVHFSDGLVPAWALPDRLAGADLAVLASRRNTATDLMLPVKLLEYVRLGIPAVVVGTRTIQHYFDEDMVRFVPEGSPEAVAAVVADLYTHPRARLEMARNARRFYDEYNFADQYARYIEIVRALSR